MNQQHITVTTADGATLAAWSRGEAQHPVVLLVHGFSLDHTTWDSVADGLLEAGYRVITTDLRGHGDSTLGTAPPTLERIGEDLAGIAAELGVTKMHVVGHSFGAFVALAARANPEAADLLSSVTSIAGTEQAVQRDRVMKLGAALFSSRLGIRLLRAKRSGRLMISTWFGKKPATADLDRIRLLSAACERPTRQAIAKATGPVDLRPTFATPGPPTLVLCGRDDKGTPLEQSERIAAAIDGARLVVIDDAGHMVMIEQPEAVLDALLAWFTDVH